MYKIFVAKLVLFLSPPTLLLCRISVMQCLNVAFFSLLFSVMVKKTMLVQTARGIFTAVKFFGIKFYSRSMWSSFFSFNTETCIILFVVASFQYLKKMAGVEPVEQRAGGQNWFVSFFLLGMFKTYVDKYCIDSSLKCKTNS